MKTLIAIVAIVIIIGLVIYIPIYRYKDCKKVGHTTMYCLLSK